MQLILLFIAIFMIAWQEHLYASQFISLKSFGFKDSDSVGIWQGLVLYKTDLDDNTALSLHYGLDVVTSASSFSNVVNGTTSASKATTGITAVSHETEEDDEEEDDEGNSQNTMTNRSESGILKISTRQSGGIGLTRKFTHDISGTTSLDLSSKSDYQSYTAGQSLTLPVLDSLTTLSGGIFYTHNNNMPVISTNNPVMIPPTGNLDSHFISGIVGLERILNKTSKIKLLVEPFTRRGYLSSGAQYIPITGGPATTSALEVVPAQRDGYALSAIYSQWLFEGAAMHLRGRYYEDTYGIKAWSSDLNYNQYLTDTLILSLKYRYYTQSAARFWHTSLPAVPTRYFTNHPALSAFNSSEYSLALRKDVSIDGQPANFNGALNYYSSSRKFFFIAYNLGFELEF